VINYLDSPKAPNFYVAMAETTRPQRLPAIFGVLSLALVGVQGELVTVELQNDSEVTGRLEEVDANMNMVLCDAQQTMSNGSLRHLEIISVNGSNVRYVHIAASNNVASTTAKYVNDFKRNTGKKGQIFDRKKKRSLPDDDGEDVILQSKAKW
jgi:small nuclear ribonucleoprotein (snRNP)-like protein